jgi:hypothetical protein
MKKINLLIFLGSFYVNVLFPQGWQWKNHETQSNLLKDKNNDLYIFASTSTGVSIKKRDLNGNVLWTKSITGGVSVTSYATDAANNIVVVGNVKTTATVDNYTLASKSASNFYILKISPSSSVLGVNVYGDSCETIANDIFINNNGDYLIGGGYKGNFNMNGTLITGDTVTQFFMIKTDPNQNVLWWETNGYVSGAKGSTSIVELLETASGNICAVYQTTGLVDYKGQQDSYDGQFIMELDPSRNLKWRQYECYCWMGYNVYTNLQSIGDVVYHERFAFYNHSGPDAWICRWTPVGTSTVKYIGDVGNFAYSTFNNKIYYAAICPNISGWYQQIGSVNSDFSGGHSDSTLIANSPGNYYTDMACVDTSAFYIGGAESALGTFVGLYRINNPTLVVDQDIQVKTGVFPNPSSGIIYVKGNQPISSAKAYNSSGSEVECSVMGSEISLGTQPKGIYFVDLFFENGSVRKKIILE